jgi:hypothetical protein
MKPIIDFLKWFFEYIGKLSTAKMVIILIFVSGLAFMGYKLFLEKEKIEFKMHPLETKQGVIVDENEDSVKVNE